ncbi:M56 family metallopeptidase [Polluticoccus soli]|uniref:M56 family metallopeptidase n=1 Tax=Polluticoccus soli TaxID=3034150 RepID=UPI0023E25224|nr:M56 family metallopeptidase [Flavipsychrobacter sp. JY13-12]
MLYLIQVISYSALMCLVYVLFLRNRPMHAFNRVYLLAAAVLPVVIPFLKFSEAVGEQIRTATAMSVRLPEVVVSTTQQSAGYDLIAAAYLCVSLILLGAFVYKIIALRRVIAKGEKTKVDGYTLVANSGFGPGSWFNYIFLPDAEQNTTIIEHEVAHIRLRHTRDIILLNVLQLFFWPNLLLVWIKKELEQVHEFQADEAANGEGYSELLVSSAFNRCTLPLSHSFMIHPIRRRLMMLKKNGGAGKYIAGAASAVVTVALFVSVVGVQSCKEKKWEVNKDTIASSEMALYQAEKMPEFNGDMNTYMAREIKYPLEAKLKNIEGKVIVEFVVDENGYVQGAKVKSSPDIALSLEAMRVVNSMPQWKPGENKGKKVSVIMTLPISFRLC